MQKIKDARMHGQALNFRNIFNDLFMKEFHSYKKSRNSLGYKVVQIVLVYISVM